MAKEEGGSDAAPGERAGTDRAEGSGGAGAPDAAGTGGGAGERAGGGPLTVGIPSETEEGETRVAMAPDAVKRLASDSVRFLVEAGAGEAAHQADAAYREAGAEVVADPREAFGADLVLKVNPPGEHPGAGRHEVELMKEGAVLVSFLRPREEPELLERLAGGGVTAFSMELIPRITRAQSMDALSAMSTLAGYKAVLLGADSLGKVFPLLMTAAGTLSPAHVLVLGCGVAGLQAIATAKRLGAVVEGYDIRPAVKEQVESLGATFVEWSEEERAEFAAAAEERETAGGYAKELEEEEQARERELVRRHCVKSDVVVTTALVPGRPAPLLITAGMVEGMRPGSVVVDLAAPAGGNCELTEPGETVVREGVVIHGPLNLPAALPTHASQMYGKNLSSFLKPLLADGRLELDLEDEILDACCVTHAGEVRFEQRDG